MSLLYVYLKHTHISSFSFVMRKTCAHPLDSLVWAAMTATPQKHTRTWLLNLFKEQLPCRVIFKIKFLASSSEKRESRSGRMRRRKRELATQFCLLISVHSARNWQLPAIYDSLQLWNIPGQLRFYDLSIIDCAQS